MSFKENLLTRITSSILPVLIIILIFTLINRIGVRINDIRDREAGDFLDIVSISLESSLAADGDFCCIIQNFIKTVNDMENKSVIIFDDEFNPIIPYGIDSPFDFEYVHTTLGYMINAYEYGSLAKYFGSDREYIYFRWQYSTCEQDLYLIVYLINQEVFNTSIIYILLYIVMVLVAIYGVKTVFFDHMIFIKILARSQTESIQNFHYRKYDD